MGDRMADIQTRVPNTPLLTTIFVIAALHAAFVVYAIYAIFTAPAGDGTGMNLVGLVPLGFLFLAGAVPAMSYARSGRNLVAGLIFAVAGFGITQWIWWTMLIHELNLV
jgi:hypothetical protein